MMASVLHVTSGLGLRKFQADGFLLTRVYICCFRGSFQNIMTHLAYDHINGSFFIPSYSKTEIIGSMQGHLYQYPETQLVKTSHSSVPAHASLVIHVFLKQFSS